MIFKNSFPNDTDYSNMNTNPLSEDNIRSTIKASMALRDEGGNPISVDGRIEYHRSMVIFCQWLRKQEDIPEDIKIKSDILFLCAFVPPFVADEFKPYIERYEREIEKGGK